MGKNLRNLIKHSYPVGNKEKLYLVIRSLNICTFGCTRRIVSHRHKFAYIIYQLICNFLPGSYRIRNLREGSGSLELKVLI